MGAGLQGQVVDLPFQGIEVKLYRRQQTSQVVMQIDRDPVSLLLLSVEHGLKCLLFTLPDHG